jgi:hypothetical protein
MKTIPRIIILPYRLSCDNHDDESVLQLSSPRMSKSNGFISRSSSSSSLLSLSSQNEMFLPGASVTFEAGSDMWERKIYDTAGSIRRQSDGESCNSRPTQSTSLSNQKQTMSKGNPCAVDRSSSSTHLVLLQQPNYSNCNTNRSSKGSCVPIPEKEVGQGEFVKPKLVRRNGAFFNVH